MWWSLKQESHDFSRVECQEAREREKKLQEAVREIRERYGTNAVLKGMNLLEGGTAKERNEQIGGHRK